MRTRAAFSITRAPTLSSFWRMVANSAQCERHAAGHGVAQREHQPVGGGVQDEAELVGERALAGGAAGGELGLVLLDEVLDLSARAVDPLVEMTGRAGRAR